MNGGTAWVFGDDVDTDALAPGIYMKGSFDQLARHCLQALNADFARQVAAGDMVVAGENFGAGSSREQAAQVLKHLGVGAVIARSFGGIFYRNALNLGLMAVVCAEVARVRAGDRIALDGAAGHIDNLTTGETIACQPIPPPLLAMVRDGGLVAHLEKKRAPRKEQGTAP